MLILVQAILAILRFVAFADIPLIGLPEGGVLNPPHFPNLVSLDCLAEHFGNI